VQSLIITGGHPLGHVHPVSQTYACQSWKQPPPPQGPPTAYGSPLATHVLHGGTKNAGGLKKAGGLKNEGGEKAPTV
jgi:hypothetical protein